MTWRPLLDGDAAARARAAIERIVDELGRREIVEASLGNGHAGIALMHGYLAAAFDDDAAAERAGGSLERALGGISRRPQPWLFSGYAGSGFVLHQLAPVLGEQDEVLAELDGLVRGWFDAERWDYAWELMFGLVGLGVYAVERGDRALIARAVDHLDTIAEDRDEGIAWRAMNDADHSTYWNLGLAHGHAGVIGWLAEVCAGDDPPPHARPLLDGAIAWLLAQQSEAPRFPPVLGRAIANDERVEGWCYGDLSTAIVLARAGSVLGRPALVATAHALAREVARTIEAAPTDPALCHGTAGHGHLFHRLGLAFADDELLAVARRSYVRTLDRLDEVAALEPGLRGGLAGIALALLAASTDLEPAWDRAFLVALPVGSCVHGQDRVERAQ